VFEIECRDPAVVSTGSTNGKLGQRVSVSTGSTDGRPVIELVEIRCWRSSVEIRPWSRRARLTGLAGLDQRVSVSTGSTDDRLDQRRARPATTGVRR
jgi:hypothetical protein